MDLTFSESETAFRDELRRWLADNPVPPRPDGGEDVLYAWRRDWQRMLYEGGWAAPHWPAEYGGRGASLTESAIYFEELGRARVPLPANVLGLLLGGPTLMVWGTDEQKERFLPRCATGEWSPAFALSEPEAGSDPASLRTSAVRTDDGDWIINGQKNWITNAGVADFYIVFAKTDRANNRSSAFIVEADREGFDPGQLEHKLGIRGSPTGSPSFTDVRVPASNLIGVEGKGLSVALATLERTRLGAAAQAVGIAQGATDYAAGYARERIAFGKPINAMQGIQFKLADMETRTAAARELLYKACAKADRNEPDLGKYSSMAKLFASDTAMAVTVEAIQVLGGYGYVNEYPVERMLRDAKITQIYEGTNEIQRVVIARSMR
jgi:alkylation response protein AidB-like acyl-CoA dehydrogenase